MHSAMKATTLTHVLKNHFIYTGSCYLGEAVILPLTSLVDWIFGHICYVLSCILRETDKEDSQNGKNQ